MKKIILSLALSIMAICTSFAQEVTIKAGTIVPLQIVNPVEAVDLDKGQKVLFRVSRDINVKGTTAIPYGTIVQGTVYKASRSMIFGIPGKLGIKIDEIVMPSGCVIPLANGNIYVKGKNQLGWSILVFCLTCLPIPCGSKAHLPNGYEIQTNIAATTTITVE